MNAEIGRIKQNFWVIFSNDMGRDIWGQRKEWNHLRNREEIINKHVQLSAITVDYWKIDVLTFILLKEEEGSLNATFQCIQKCTFCFLE